MFESTKLGREVSKSVFKDQLPDLRTRMLAAQRALREQKIPLVILLAGVEGAGKGEVTNRLLEWLDSRGVQTWAFWDESDEERERPRYWRYWRALPAAGEISILFGGWYLTPLEKHFLGQIDDADLESELHRIQELERMLIFDGILVAKFWFHMDEKAQKARLKSLSRDDKSRWKMLPDKKKFAEHYQGFETSAEQLIRHTDLGKAPWHLIEASDERYRDLTVGQRLLETIENRLAQSTPNTASPETASQANPRADTGQITLLDRLDLDKTLEKAAYKERLETLQEQLNELTWKAYKAKKSTLLVFEGVDAAGKGGAIRRLTQAIDARLYRVVPIAAPSDEEKAHHYLWRFWRQIPRAGRVTIFDRSWYGRVLVERVENFATTEQWQRAYLEINQFEEQLTESGTVLIKFWLQISNEEQLQRFKAREETPFKQHKITDEDWRNREKWDAYRDAINEMLTRTSPSHAPWTLVPANDKYFARIQVLETVVKALSQSID